MVVRFAAADGRHGARTGSLDCQKTKTDRKAELLKELAELEASA